MGPTLVCPSTVREYTAFLREDKVDVMNPAINPMIRVTMKEMTAVIVILLSQDRGAAVGTKNTVTVEKN